MSSINSPTPSLQNELTMKHVHACLSFRIIFHPVAVAFELSSPRPNNENSDHGETAYDARDRYDCGIFGVPDGI
jgi:hypothetical protein